MHTKDLTRRKISPYRALFRAVRIHQWIKNILLFAPLVLAHRITEWSLVLASSRAFLSFCLAVSSAYLLNDILDMEADRNHPVKKYRPIAAGDLPLFWGWVLVPVLLLMSIVLGISLPGRFLLILSMYLLITITYSLFLKKILLLDVITLSGLYNMRIIAGAFAVEVRIS